MQLKMCHSDRSEDKTPTKQCQETGTGRDMSDSKQHCDIRSDASRKIMMKSSEDCMDGKVRTRSWQISHIPERLRIDIH